MTPEERKELERISFALYDKALERGLIKVRKVTADIKILDAVIGVTLLYRYFSTTKKYLLIVEIKKEVVIMPVHMIEIPNEYSPGGLITHNYKNNTPEHIFALITSVRMKGKKI